MGAPLRPFSRCPGPGPDNCLVALISISDNQRPTGSFELKFFQEAELDGAPAKDLSKPGPDAHAGSDSDPGADVLLPLVYDQLRRLAQHMMAKEQPGQTLQATALVHEAYLRLSDSDRGRWTNRHHFYIVAAKAMRRILVERARRRGRLKRGGGRKSVALTDSDLLIDTDSLDLVNLDEALRRLSTRDPRVGQVVMLRFFAGLSIEETAETLDISASTAKRDWNYAKAWLYRAMREDED